VVVVIGVEHNAREVSVGGGEGLNVILNVLGLCSHLLIGVVFPAVPLLGRGVGGGGGSSLLVKTTNLCVLHAPHSLVSPQKASNHK
jgi:hypothetical protein